MSIKQTLSVLATGAVVLGLGGLAEAQLAKRGAYAAHFWFEDHEKVYFIEDGHYFSVGELTGTFFNDAGEGFLHRASAVCPGEVDIVKDILNVHRYCLITDEDGDKATFVYRCKGKERCEGHAEWLGGTGKYKGLKGRHTISGVSLPMGDRGEFRGYHIMKGEWQLQD